MTCEAPRVKLGMAGKREDPRFLEKRFGGHGEELGRVRRAVRVEHGVTPDGVVAPESLVLLLHDLAPGRVLPAAREDRCPVRRAVLHVEDVGELVEDQVPAGVPTPDGRLQIVPRDDGDAVLPRLAQPHLLAPRDTLPPLRDSVDLAI